MRNLRHDIALWVAVIASLLSASPLRALEIQLLNGWTDAPAGTGDAEVVVQDGIVRFKGAIAGGSGGLAFNLPQALRPLNDVYVAVSLCNANQGRLLIEPTGDVFVQTPGGAFGDAQCLTSLDGASFVQSASGSQPLALEAAWTNGPLSTGQAAAVLIGETVHLKGAVGGGMTVRITTLPLGLRPATNVYVPIGLCGAAKGRLHIRPTGEVDVQALASFGDATCFTSLDGVEFVVSPIGLAGWPLPAYFPGVVLSDSNPVTFKIDLSTLPIRPALIVEVVPPASHPNMQLQIEATSWNLGSGYVFNCSSSLFSTSGPGLARLALDSLYACPSGPNPWTGATAEIKIRALDFGGASPPATVSVVIRGETRPPTGTAERNVDPPFVSRTVAFPASKDAVLYQDLPDGSNGRGEYLWAGQRTVSAFLALARHALLGFDLASEIAPSAVVQSASLAFDVEGIVPLFSAQRLIVERVAPDPFDVDWEEGFLNASGNEFDGAPGSASGADWTYRSRLSAPWATPGGDVTGPVVLDTTIGTTGTHSLSSPALVTAVQSMVSSSSGSDGLRLRNPPVVFSTVSAGLQIASRENPTAALPPTLTVQYYPTEVVETGEIPTGTISYIDAAQNFRWIYDLDQDGTYVTPIAGICEATTGPNPNLIPYTYRYQGSPAFTGVDCCTWRITSGLGIVGTGQALFFHNLDANNPANRPPDSDRDGIRNLCDNCPYYANGPLLGACITGTVGAPCHANQACGSGGLCSLSQEDANGDFIGDICAPEPGFAAGLGSALMGLAALARVRSRSSRLPAQAD